VSARLAGALGLAVALCTSAVALAQEVDDFGAYNGRERRHFAESPQHAALEFRLGRYLPSVDDEFNGPTPYETTFGNDNRFVVGLEVDWQLLRIPYLGTLSPGIGVAYTKSTGRGFVTSTGERAGEDTSLIIFPLYLDAVLRADVIARETPVPIVPYAKLGVGFGLWRVTNGGGTARVGSLAGSGLSVGPQVALGGMLLLDPLDPNAARSLDQEIGINNTYFFMEWYFSKLGGGDQLEVGTSTWCLGLAFEM
jgi:hypothetical protein